MFTSATDAVALVKCSKRTLRQPARCCGKVGLYWGHDTSRTVGKYCAEHRAYGFVLLETDLTRHSLVCPARNDSAPRQEASATVPSEPQSDAEPQSVPVPTATNDDTAQAIAALRSLFGSLASASVDRATVESIVKSHVDNVIFPQTVIVEREGHEAVKIEAAHEKLPRLVQALLAGRNMMLVGSAGTGKSTLAEHAAQALSLPFYGLSLCPQTSESKVFGYMNADGKYIGTLFRQCYEFGGVFNFDEIDNAHPSILAAINGAVAGNSAAFPDGMVAKHKDFRIVASGNTWGRGADRSYVARQTLDAATLTRFVAMDVPIDLALERRMCLATGMDSASVDSVLAFTRACRANADASSLNVVICPRQSVDICELVLAGWTVPEALDATCRKGLSDADWHKVTNGAPTVSVTASVSV